MFSIHNGWHREASPSYGDRFPPDVVVQLQLQQASHRSLVLSRAMSFWWYRILAVILSGCVATVFGAYALNSPNSSWKLVGGIVALAFIYVAVRHLEFGLLLTTIVAVLPLPQILVIKNLNISPALMLLLLLFSVIVLQVAFHAKRLVLPSLRFIWPLLGLIVAALLSELAIQLAWAPGVPHQLNGNPLLYEDALGLFILFVPLLCLIVTTASLTGKEHWVEYIQYAFLIIAVSMALVILVDFKHVGVDVYRFRFVEPRIAGMDLRDLATLTGLGSILAYVHFLYADHRRTRIIYGVAFLVCLLGTYITLYNSEWMEVGAALAVITLFYSWRWFLGCCLAALAFTPVIIPVALKLFSTKSSEDFSRLFVWQDMLRIWGKYPLLGVGPGNLWTYDQYFTQLPPTLRNFATSGLGVAHNGYLQVLGEQGLVGLIFWLALIMTIAVTAVLLFRRSKDVEHRRERILALVSLGMICGAAVADFFSGGYILLPRQVGGFNELSNVFGRWIIFGCVIFKYQLRGRIHNG